MTGAAASLVRPAAVLVIVLVLVVAGRLDAAAQTGTVRGDVRSVSDGLPLAGVVIRAVAVGHAARGRRVVSDRQGAFVVTGLAPGAWELRTAYRGFVRLTRLVEVRAGETVETLLQLTLSPMREELNVPGGDPALADRVSALTVVPAHLLDVSPLTGDSFTSLLPILPGVVRQPDGRLSLNGGRPEQSGLQVGGANVTDPVTGGYGIDLPVDAVESVTRFSSPYRAEYGRFSSGVLRIDTRRSENDWRVSVSSFMPTPRLRGGQIQGLSSFSPRLLVGGAIVRDRLFLTQSLQYETRTVRVPALPEGQDLHKLERISSFTRVDATLADGHTLVGTLALFPRERRFVTLDTFNPQAVTPDVQERGYQIDLQHQSVMGEQLLVTSEVNLRQYDVDVLPQADGPMVFTPDGRQGSFFHRDERQSRSYQWIQTVSRGVDRTSGTHLLKAGVDVLHSRYDGVVTNRPVELLRADGSLAERIEFPGAARVSTSGTDVAVFVQDRWRVSDRLLIEGGLRLDRDGVLDRFTWSPRGSVTVGLLASGRGILRGGIGMFARRTPLNIGTFEDLSARVVWRFAADGVSVSAPAEIFVHASAAFDVPRSVVWSIGYDHRLTERLIARVTQLRRDGRHEFIVQPVRGAEGAAIVLSSDGRSDYQETELTLAYKGNGGLEAVASYLRARADGDFNHFDRFFGDLPTPIIRANARGPFDIDVPRRLLLRGSFPLSGGRWIVAPLVEIRSGFPYSAVDEDYEFEGTPNAAGRFPVLATVDLALSRRLTIKGKDILVGVRGYNVLNRFTPRDVQQNLTSPAFGSFYNGIERRFGFVLQLNAPAGGT
ncbi:MAG TPA: TonB-dependent receptor [Vicinamibacterales bacterium]|nr:TonB-dependent receptor [Vicinamibacterales bacterium]